MTIDSYRRGTRADLVVTWFEYPGGPAAAVTGTTVTISPIGGGAAPVSGASALGLATGVDYYGWDIADGQAIDRYLVAWLGFDAEGDEVTAWEVISVTGDTSAGSTGPCQAWEPIWCEELPTGSEAVSGTMLEAASAVLWAKTAMRFGECQVTVRPCRRSCADAAGWWEWGTWPRPALIGGSWYNLACGSCRGDCSCSVVHEVRLPGPVAGVDEVKVDGVPLVAGTDYRLDPGGLLVRLGGQSWPLCNDLNEADTEQGTWSVTYRQGEPVPVLGRQAVGELATQFMKACLQDDSCLLSQPVQQITRQGVSLTFVDPDSLFESGRIGLYFSDLFVSTYNPSQLQAPARIWDPGAMPPRRTL